MSDFSKAGAGQISMMVRVTRKGPGDTVEPIYRYLWAGDMAHMIEDDVSTAFLIRSQAPRCHAFLRINEGGANDFSVAQFASAPLLKGDLLGRGMSEQDVARLDLPDCSMAGAQGQGKERQQFLPAPFADSASRFVAAAPGCSYHLEASVLHDGYLPVFRSHLAVGGFFALPVGPIGPNDFDVQYVFSGLADQRNSVVRSACRDGCVSFALTTCADDTETLELLLSRGVEPKALERVGLLFRPALVR